MRCRPSRTTKAFPRPSPDGGIDVQAPNSFAWAGRLADGVPPIPDPDLGNGIIPIPGNVTAFTIPKKFNRGYIKSWTAAVQKELKWGFVAEAAYVATRQIDQRVHRRRLRGQAAETQPYLQQKNRQTADRHGEQPQLPAAQTTAIAIWVHQGAFFHFCCRENGGTP